VKVRVLDGVVADQIAAGEVVERPASVLKELLENSLDAGARTIDISLKAGGTALVRVVDDGTGMERADALLCVERHATSKIRSVDDLDGVRTLGFRGEALPSIASVSKFELRTRTAEDEVGTELRIEGGTLEAVSEVACNVGTDLSVRSLFFNLPARRKFLRSRETELAHCVEAVQRAVMMRPEVDLTLRHEGRTTLRAPASADLAVRVRDLLGDAAKVMVPIEAERDGVHLHGLIGPVGVHRPAAVGSAYLYVNGRFVRDPVLRRALTEAYQGAVPKGRYPVVVLAVDVGEGEVDVNVHPAKIEVRFRDPRLVSDALVETVRDALRGPGPRRVITTPSRGEPDVLPLLDVVSAPARPGLAAHPDEDVWLAARAQRVPVAPVVAERGEAVVLWPLGAAAAPSGGHADEQARAGLVGAAAAGGSGSEGADGRGARAAEPAQASPSAGAAGSEEQAPGEGSDERSTGVSVAPERGGPGGAAGDAEATLAAVERALRVGSAAVPGPVERGVSSPPGGVRPGPMRVDQVVAERFALTFDPDGLVVYDLRALAVSLEAAALRAHAKAQPLLAPTAVDLGRAERAAVLAAADALSELGVELRAFGPGTLAVMAVPASLRFASVPALLGAVAAAAQSGADLAEAIAEAASYPVSDVYAAKELFVRWREAGRGAVPGRRIDAEALARWCRGGSIGG
jgi:DNA mismatch repair protein MutL